MDQELSQSSQDTADSLAGVASMYEPVSGGWVYKNVYFDSLSAFVLAVVVEITPSEYRACVASSENQWSNQKKGQYGTGMIRTDFDPYKPNRIGKLGEVAFAKAFGGAVDMGFKRYGDKYDLKVGGKTIDIKTAASKHGSLLVRERTEKGKTIKPTKDLYVAACLLVEDPVRSTATVALLGFCSNEALRAAPLVQGVRGQHMNRQLHYNELQPVDDLEKVLFL